MYSHLNRTVPLMLGRGIGAHHLSLLHSWQFFCGSERSQVSVLQLFLVRERQLSLFVCRWLLHRFIGMDGNFDQQFLHYVWCVAWLVVRIHGTKLQHRCQVNVLELQLCELILNGRDEEQPRC